MNADLFSAEAFEQASQTVFKDALARQLRNEVEAELANVVSRVMQDLVNDLNAAGHKLVPHGTQTATELHFRDECGPNGYRLLLACDIVITTDYVSHQPQ